MTLFKSRSARFSWTVIVAGMLTMLAEAGEVRCTLWGGYGYAPVGAINEQLQTVAQRMTQRSGGTPASVTPLAGILNAGMDVLYRLTPRLWTGARISLMGASGFAEGRTTVWGYTMVNPPYDPIYAARSSTDLFCTALMAGGVYTSQLSPRWMLSGGLFIGYGRAQAHSLFEWFKETGYQESTWVHLYGDGTGLACELVCRATFLLTENFTVVGGIDLRSLYVPELSPVRSYETFYPGTTEELTVKFIKPDGTPVPVDFSGVGFTAGIGYRF